MRILVSVLVILGVFFLALVAGLYYTPMPFWALQYVLLRSHTKAGGFSGSIAHGPRIGYLKSSDGHGGYTILQDFELRYDDLLAMKRRREIHFTKLKIGGLEYLPGAWSAAQSNPPDTTRSARSQGTGWTMIIDDIEFSSITIHQAGGAGPLHLESLRIKNCRVGGPASGIDSLHLRSDVADFDLDHGPAPDISSGTAVSFRGVLKSVYFKRLLQPTQIVGRIVFRPDSKLGSDFEASAFDGKVGLRSMDDGSVALSVTDFDAASYFADIPPIHGITLQAVLGPPVSDLKAWKIVSGEFLIGATHFTAAAPDAVYQEGAQKSSLVLTGTDAQAAATARLGFTFPETFNSNGDDLARLIVPWAELKSDRALSPDELLSSIVFSKKLAKLDDKERQEFDRDRKFFAPQVSDDASKH